MFSPYDDMNNSDLPTPNEGFAPFFTDEFLHTFVEELRTIDSRIMSLIERFFLHSYRHPSSKEHAVHGFSRRLYTLARCVRRVFDVLPPQLNNMPTNDAVEDATVYIQAFVLNAFGALDNLAWIWVFENDVTGPDGKPLDRKFVGLRSGNKAVRQSLPPATADYLKNMDSWFKDLSDFRDALAHRIPLYVIPYVVPPENNACYLELEKSMRYAKDLGEYQRLKEEQMKLVVFRPIMKHTLSDGMPPVVFHAQLLNDLKAVEAVAAKILDALSPKSEDGGFP